MYSRSCWCASACPVQFSSYVLLALAVVTVPHLSAGSLCPAAGLLLVRDRCACMHTTSQTSWLLVSAQVHVLRLPLLRSASNRRFPRRVA